MSYIHSDGSERFEFPDPKGQGLTISEMKQASKVFDSIGADVMYDMNTQAARDYGRSQMHIKLRDPKYGTVAMVKVESIPTESEAKKLVKQLKDQMKSQNADVKQSRQTQRELDRE